MKIENSELSNEYLSMRIEHGALRIEDQVLGIEDWDTLFVMALNGNFIYFSSKYCMFLLVQISIPCCFIS